MRAAAQVRRLAKTVPVNFRDPRGLKRHCIGPEDDVSCHDDDDDPMEGGDLELYLGPDTQAGTPGPVDVKLGNETFHKVVNSGAQYDVVKQRLDTIQQRLKNDSECLKWLQTGSSSAIVTDANLFKDLMANHTGVAQYIDVDGSKRAGDGIGAQAKVSAKWSIVVSAAGGFFYGGSIPGTQLSGGTESGQIELLLHELAHLTGTLSAGDLDLDLNRRNNAATWQNCQKTITGR